MNLVHNDTNKLTLEATCPFNWIIFVGAGLCFVYLNLGVTIAMLGCILRVLEATGFHGR